ncbi:tRNA (adenosine(37)-N6)-threonylcarbamoyltransferase complex dimerization subunit type 1 TsaB [bacterium]|nr:tRNA (adenosine(37)-N6)-threonylcarbamoyltransferase complex dimerization subunit type 1 TsaB [bacterium]
MSSSESATPHSSELPKILAIDTSTTILRWTGVLDGVPHNPVTFDASLKHYELLASGIKDWLLQNRWDSVDAVAIVHGPGGYTGLRVGVAFTVSFAAARGIPVIPIRTFDLFAARAEKGSCVLGLLPLRRGVCRAQLMRGGVPVEYLGEEFEIDLSTIKVATKEPLILLGDGYLRNKDKFDSTLADQIIHSPQLKSNETALAQLASYAYSQHNYKNALEVDVHYGGEFKPTPKKRSQ